MTLLLVVGIAGSIGAMSRYLLDGLVQDRTTGRFPFGTLYVNVAGSFVLGCMTALALRFSGASATTTVVGVGFCGAFTTWSTASFETISLLDDGSASLALRSLVANLAGSLLAAGAGFLLVRYL